MHYSFYYIINVINCYNCLLLRSLPVILLIVNWYNVINFILVYCYTGLLLYCHTIITFILNKFWRNFWFGLDVLPRRSIYLTNFIKLFVQYSLQKIHTIQMLIWNGYSVICELFYYTHLPLKCPEWKQSIKIVSVYM